MKTHKFTESSFQLTRLGLFNCYLVRESDGFTLIDTGLPGTARTILPAVRAAGASIRRILLTHAHTDHAGSVDALVASLGKVDLVASSRSVPLLRKPPDKTLRPGEAPGKIKGSLSGIKATVTHEIADGELFGSLRCIETPGHIPGHFSFLDERDGTLFAGDALVCVGKLAVSGYAPWYFPAPNLATWDKATALTSARKLLQYPIERFAAGHGAVRSGGLPALRKALGATRR